MNENEMKSLESQLLSLRPRRPSAGLKRKLFAMPVNARRRMAWVLGSLAPATACLVLTVSMFNPENYAVSSHSSPALGMILGNGSYAAYASGNECQSQNSLFSVTFDWTNHGEFPSSMSPFSRSR